MLRARDCIFLATGAALAIAGMILFSPTMSHAASWTGCYAGGIGSYNALVQDGGGVGLEGPSIAATVGCDLQRDKFVVGALAEYGFGRLDAGGTDVDVKGWALGGRAGYLIWDNTLAYGLVKYTDLKFDPGYGDVSLNGPVVGGGLEVGLGGGFFTRLEYNYSILSIDQYDEDVNVHSGRLGFVYKFGGSDPVIPAFDAPAARPLK